MALDESNGARNMMRTANKRKSDIYIRIATFFTNDQTTS